MFNKLEARVLSEYKRSRAAPSTFCTLIKHYFSFIKHYINKRCALVFIGIIIDLHLIALIWAKLLSISSYITIKMCFLIVFSEVALRAAKSVKRDVVTLHEVLRVKKIKSRAQQITLNPNIIKVKNILYLD